MGTHLCAFPTGEHCPRGLVCLGCQHAQPKRAPPRPSAACSPATPRPRTRPRPPANPPGRLAARELEVERIRGALHRAEGASTDAAAALEAAAV